MSDKVGKISFGPPPRRVSEKMDALMESLMPSQGKVATDAWTAAFADGRAAGYAEAIALVEEMIETRRNYEPLVLRELDHLRQRLCQAARP